MASALPGDICVGQHSVCIIRAAKLDGTCTPVGGEDGGFISTGIITATASMDFQEGQQFEPLDGCGNIAWTYETLQRIKRVNINGELVFFDHEMMEVLFGGTLLVGDTGTAFDGDNIGWAAPNYTDDPPDPIYLELVVKTAGQGVGACAPASSPFPFAVGYIFGKAQLTPGDRTFELDAATVTFDGFSTANPNLGKGPWGDYPAVGYIPTSPYVQVSYGEAEYDAIAELAACGYATLPAFSS